MLILNTMLGKHLGGIEQSFLDYSEALSCDHKVINLVNSKGLLKEKTFATKVEKAVFAYKKFSISAHLSIFFYVRKLKPAMILVHYKKSLSFFIFLGKILKIPVIAIAHNPKTKHIIKAKYIISVSEFQRKIFIEKGFAERRIFVVPNMIKLDNSSFKEFYDFQQTPVVGLLARFDPMKSFETLIFALDELRNRNISVKVVIGGSPIDAYKDYYSYIVNLIKEKQLDDSVTLVGWVHNKDDFYENIDIFAMTSKSEPFGITVLEALKYSKIIISSNAEGPAEILQGKDAALLYEKENHSELADKIEFILKNKNDAKKLAKKAYELAKHYDLHVIGKKLSDVLYKISQLEENKA